MSVLQQALSDARKLATRLRDHDNSADNLLSQAQDMFKQVESMKEVSTSYRIRDVLLLLLKLPGT